MAISHSYWHLVVKNGNCTLLLTSNGQEMAISHCYWHLVVKNGNFTLLQTSSCQEWQFHTLANGPPKWIKNRWLEYCYTKLGRQTFFGQWTQLVLTSSGQDVFKFGRYTPRSAGRSTCHQYWHLVVKNGNFTLLLTSSGQKCNFILQLISSGQEWQFHIATHI